MSISEKEMKTLPSSSPSSSVISSSLPPAATASSSSSSGSSRRGKTRMTTATGRAEAAKVAAGSSLKVVGLKRGPWTAEEDQLLANYIKREGEGRWRTLPKKAGLLRCGKSCRLRWMNYLRPSVKRGHISPDEEDLILRLHRLLGNRWSLIAGRIPGRTDNEIKNYWNTHLSKKLISQGIDPKTHKPLPNPNSPSPSIHTNKPVVSPQNNNTNAQLGDNNGSKTLQVAVPTAGKPCDEAILKGNQDKDDDDDMVIICSSSSYDLDDPFSSFFDSLINDDMFNNQLFMSQDEQDQDHDLQHDLFNL